MNVESESNIITGGPLSQEYELLQFHFHTPAEHLIDGIQYPLELHLVHVPLNYNNTNLIKKERIVLGMLFNATENYTESILTNVIDGIISLQNQSLPTQSIDWNINLHDLFVPLIEQHSFYSYLGSLTTPPCTEDVTWYVMSQPLSINVNQLNYFINIMNNTARPTQPLYNRQITYYVPQSSIDYVFWGVWGAIVVGLVAILIAYICHVRRKKNEKDPAKEALLANENENNTYRSCDKNPTNPTIDPVPSDT